MRGRTGGKPGSHVRTATLLLTILLMAPSGAFGDAGEFVPTLYSSGGDLELRVVRENTSNTASSGEIHTSETFASERLRYYIDGYVYHPRFIQFLVKGAGGYSQERSVDNIGSAFSDTSLKTDYEIRTKILPEHPYNLELYTLSVNPFSQKSSAQTRATDTEQGALFNYAARPLLFNLSYNAGESKTRVSSSEYRSERASGSYQIGPANNTAACSHTDSSTSMGARATADFSSFENVLSTPDLSLNSRVSENRSKQNSPFSPTLDTDAFSWQEQFNALLPWNMSTSASYNAQKNAMTTEASDSGPGREAITETKTSNFTLAHKLYDSVRTNYSLNRTRAETSSGDTTSLTNSLSGVYTKKIPRGRFTVSAQGSRSRMDQENAPLVVGEAQSASLFGVLTLSRENIDPATISIKAVSDTGQLYDLVKDVNYIVEPFGSMVKIQIVLLPPELAAGHPMGYLYAFQVSYALVARTVELETTTVGYALNLSLFDNLITPYYSRRRSEQAVLAGTVPGGPRATEAVVLGVGVQKAPYALATEQRIVESNINPSRSLRNAVEYANRMSDTLNLSAKAEHTKTLYGQGPMGSGGHAEQLSAVSVGLSKSLPREKLTGSLAASFSHRHATIDTDLYAITGSLTWKVGALSVDLGASLNRGRSTGAVERQVMLSEFYYLSVSRKLF